MNQRRYWRPPWEEEEGETRRTGAGYPGPQGRPTQGGAGSYPRMGGFTPRDDVRNRCSEEAPGPASREKNRHVVEPRQHTQQCRCLVPPEYCEVCDRRKWRRDRDGDRREEFFNDHRGRRHFNLTERNDGYYPATPHCSRHPYSCDDRLFGDCCYDRKGDVAGYGVGLPVQDNDSGAPCGGSSASPTGSTTSIPTEDDISDSSRGPAGEIAVDLSNVYARNKTESDPPAAAVASGADDESSDSETTTTERIAIELIPGVKVELRGAKETWEAFQRKFYVAVTCIGCSANVFCIMDADYVLCPVCRVVSPLEIISNPSRYRRVGGLGLGFTMDKPKTHVKGA